MSDPRSSTRSIRRALGLLRETDYRRLWVGETVSQFGSQVSLLAIPYIATVLLLATPFEVALLGALQFLPFLLFTLPAGAWVDRLRRRPILISGDLVRVVALGTIPLTWAFGVLTIWQLYLVSFVAGIATVFFDVAYQSYLPALVEHDQLVEGNSKLQASEASAAVVGPGFGGALIGLVGAPFAIIADALSYLTSAFFVSRIARTEPHPEAARLAAGLAREPLRRQVAEGLQFVLGNPYLRAIAGATSSSNLGSTMIFAIMPVYLYRELGLTAATVGLIFGIGALGSLGGALVANQVAARVGLGRTIIGSMALGGPAMLLLPLAPHDAPIAWLVASVALMGFASVVYNINQVSYRQAICPTAIQGRMNATMRFLVWGTIPVGSIIGGLVATAVGVHDAIWIGAFGSCLPFLSVLLSPVRSLRRMPEALTTAEPAAGNKG
ncbi:MAG TPA: MFS transporter [Candidatus Acidoferrales bacterium]|nr:MFS transporter [Candidatus Acidoferrales bacterium]